MKLFGKLGKTRYIGYFYTDDEGNVLKRASFGKYAAVVLSTMRPEVSED